MINKKRSPEKHHPQTEETERELSSSLHSVLFNPRKHIMKLIQPISIGLLLAISLTSTALANPRSLVTPASGLQGIKQKPSSTSGFGGSGILRDRCPEGQKPSSWQKPIYDKNGLFVVGWETVATCIPEGLKPAG